MDGWVDVGWMFCEMMSRQRAAGDFQHRINTRKVQEVISICPRTPAAVPKVPPEFVGIS